uniref:NADH dehydrogenase subunit 4L n=1 Tax=Pyganodon grandis TaxID=96932 RepID=D2DW52_PYGGR|nr:NADH dehydrogenase subunit 4L [Pyganodon grandis]
MYVLSVCCLLLQLHSLLSILLGLEVISLIMCFNFTCSFVHAQGFGSFVLVFLCFEVSIMSVLLSMMVALVKTSGSDYVGMLSPSRAF